MTTPAPMTLADAQSRLSDWESALQAASTGASYSVEGQTVTRQDITQIRAEIQRWHNTVLAIQANNAGRQRSLGSQAAFAAPGAGTGSAIIPDSLWTDGRT